MRPAGRPEGHKNTEGQFSGFHRKCSRTLPISVPHSVSLHSMSLHSCSPAEQLDKEEVCHPEMSISVGVDSRSWLLVLSGEPKGWDSFHPRRGESSAHWDQAACPQLTSQHWLTTFFFFLSTLHSPGKVETLRGTQETHALTAFQNSPFLPFQLISH